MLSRVRGIQPRLDTQVPLLAWRRWVGRSQYRAPTYRSSPGLARHRRPRVEAADDRLVAEERAPGGAVNQHRPHDRQHRDERGRLEQGPQESAHRFTVASPAMATLQ